MDEIHKRFKRLRVKKGLNMKQFAELIGVPESTYREWEYGRTLAGPPYIKMAEVLDVPISFLMTGELAENHWILQELKQMELQIVSIKTRLVSRI